MESIVLFKNFNLFNYMKIKMDFHHKFNNLNYVKKLIVSITYFLNVIFKPDLYISLAMLLIE